MNPSLFLEVVSSRIRDARQLHTKLVFLTGGTAADRESLLAALEQSLGVTRIDLGASVAAALVPLSRMERRQQVGELLRTAAARDRGPALLLDRVEILFDPSLAVDVLSLLKRQASDRPVLVNWPGEWRNGHLTYAPLGHPEHRDYVTNEAHVVRLQQGE